MSGEPVAVDAHQSFIKYVMSDVYALLDYLSGRATPPIVPPGLTALRHHRAMPSGKTDRAPAEPAPDGFDLIEDDLMDKNVLLSRTMKIGRDLETCSVSAADSAFLILARDFLNRQAAPATGSTISFTIRVVHELLGRNRPGAHASTRSDYLVKDTSLDDAAAGLARFVRRQVRILAVLLLVTVAVSTYVACGKLLLDTRDAVNRDYGNNVAAIMSEAKQQRLVPKTLAEGATTAEWMEMLCATTTPSPALNLSCGQHTELKIRKDNIHELLGLWMFFTRFKALPDEEGAQWATTMIGIIGNYVLPVLYGWLGSLGYVLRRLNRQLANYLLTPRELRANLIRIVLGVVTGACIGLFVNNSAGAATLTGLGGAAVTLSASGIAFLAGYGVEAVFKLVDALIDHVFRTSEEQQARPAA